MDILVSANQQKLTFISSMWTLEVAKRTFKEQLVIGIDGERASKESGLLACLDDEDDDDSESESTCIEAVVDMIWALKYLRFIFFIFCDNLQWIS